MAILKIYKYPAPVLKRTAKPVEKVDAEIKQLLDDMAETMYAAPGVGLAAPQVGVSLRCIVVDVGTEQEDGKCEPNLLQLVNPEIISKKGEIEWEEGCLSVPEFTIKMTRSAEISVRALNKSGKKIEFEAGGLLAVAIQHEIDHLNGKLLIDNLSPLKRELYVKEQKKKHLRNNEPTYL